MAGRTGKNSIRWIALACLVVPMFASYFGNFIGDYSLLCVCGGLIVGLGAAAICLALALRRSSSAHPELLLDESNRK